MKNLSAILFLGVFLTHYHPAICQTMRLASYNDSGSSYENLYYNQKSKVWKYSSLQAPALVTLQTVGLAEGKSGETIFMVKFPNDPAKVYTLAPNGAFLTCTDPNGVEQTFAVESKYISKNEQGIEEYIFESGPPLAYKYASAQYPNPIDLIGVGGDMMQGYTDVIFPGQSERYRLTFSPSGDLLVTNMNEQGKVQIFVLEQY